MSRKPPAAWRCALAFLLGLAGGAAARRFLFRRFLGYDVHPQAIIGNCFVRVHYLKVGPSALIGDFTVIRNLDRIELEDNARIGTLNWIYGMPGRSDRYFLNEEDRVSAFVMKGNSSLTSRHIVDCTNLVEIGAFSTVAGFRTQILTHGISLEPARQRSAPVKIGDYCLIGSGSIILKGATLPTGTVIGAGSTVRGELKEPYSLYSGVPAEKIKSFDPDADYFTRTSGRID